jgi:hypothetical protein
VTAVAAAILLLSFFLVRYLLVGRIISGCAHITEFVNRNNRYYKHYIVEREVQDTCHQR